MRDEKKLLLDELTDKIESSAGFIMTSYQGLTAALARQFRDHLSEVNGEFEIVRKRVFLKALEKKGTPVKDIKLEGHIGIMFAEKEALPLVKAVVKFSEANNDMFTLVGGVIENVMCDGKEITELSKLPSLQELRAQFVGLLQAPMAQTVGTMQAQLASLLYCFDAKCDKG